MGTNSRDKQARQEYAETGTRHRSVLQKVVVDVRRAG